MRALAEYVMKGRTEAIIAAVLTTGTLLLAWIGAAIVALVTLRRGPAQGSRVLAWTMIPALALVMWGDTGPVTTLLGVALAAMVLRATASWSWALVAAVMAGLVTAALMASVGQSYIDYLLKALGEILAQVVSQQENAEAPLQLPSRLQVAGLLGLSNAFTVIMCLMLARWWQALLYNPGGFQVEFHRLRLSPPLAVTLLVIGLGLSSLGRDFTLWAVIAGLPFVFAGFGLVHGLAAKKGLGVQWLVMFYVTWLLLDPFKGLVIVVAVVDSWIDFRARVGNSPGSNSGHK